MDCEVCGRQATTQALVEGARLSVCAECASFGKELVGRVPAGAAQKQFSQPRKLVELELAENYGKIVSVAREKLGLDVYQLGRNLSINADYLKQIERGERGPDEKTGRKLEAALKIKLFQ